MPRKMRNSLFPKKPQREIQMDDPCRLTGPATWELSCEPKQSGVFQMKPIPAVQLPQPHSFSLICFNMARKLAAQVRNMTVNNTHSSLPSTTSLFFLSSVTLFQGPKMPAEGATNCYEKWWAFLPTYPGEDCKREWSWGYIRTAIAECHSFSRITYGAGGSTKAQNCME